MKKLLVVLAILSGVILNAQDVTDFSRALLNKRIFEVAPALDSLGIWYYKHNQHNVDKESIVLTIEDANGISYFVKAKLEVNSYDFMNSVINSVAVNFSHDNSKQIKALHKLTGYDHFHVGIRSTDIFYNLKK